jgi:hypothetical protein
MSYLATGGKNDAATGVTGGITHISAHTGYPSTAGSNEIGSRVAVSWGSASSGSVVQSGTATLSVAGGNTVKWIGGWSASTAGTFKAAWPAGSQTPKEYTVDTSTDVFTCASHGYSDTNVIVFVGGTPPGGLTEGTEYFIRDSATNTFKVAATSGGSAIDITSAPAASSVVVKLIAETFGSNGSLDVSNLTVSPGAI